MYKSLIQISLAGLKLLALLNGGAAVALLAYACVERLGIAEEMRAKTVFLPAGGLIGVLVANGKAEIAVHEFQQLLQVPEIEIVGPLPADLQNTVVFATAILNGTTNAEASRLLMDFLRTPEAAVVMKARGIEPITP